MAASLCFAQAAWAQNDDSSPRRADVKSQGDVDPNAGAGGARIRADAGARVNDPRDRNNQDDRRNARQDDQNRGQDGNQANDRAQASNRANDPRYRFHQGRWWFRTASGNWLYWQNNQWHRFQGGARTYSQASGPRYYSNGGYNSGGYYSQPYYGNSYYNNGYYGAGYRGYPYGNNGYYNGYNGYGYNNGYGYYNGPGYGNAGWGGMNYGSRGANRGSNIGGMIDQGLGGSGQAGAALGGAISR
jgi:hypothetical protein